MSDDTQDSLPDEPAEIPGASDEVLLPQELLLTGDPFEVRFLFQEVQRLGAENGLLRMKMNYFKGICQQQKAVITTLAKNLPAPEQAQEVTPNRATRRATKAPTKKPVARRAPRK